MTVTKTVAIAGIDVLVREITVGQVRDWLRDLDAQGDAVDVCLFDDISLPDLYRMTSLTREQADVMAPRQLREVVEAARALNADFFAMRARLAQLGARLQKNSSGQSAE